MERNYEKETNLLLVGQALVVVISVELALKWRVGLKIIIKKDTRNKGEIFHSSI